MLNQNSYNLLLIPALTSMAVSSKPYNTNDIMPDIACRIYTMWRGKDSFPKFVHVISKWNRSMSSYRIFLLEYISWINSPIVTHTSVHSLTNRHLKQDSIVSHFVSIFALRSSATRSGIDRNTVSHTREWTVSNPGQTNSICWATSLCAVSHSLNALLSKLNCMLRGWRPCILLKGYHVCHVHARIKASRQTDYNYVVIRQ